MSIAGKKCVKCGEVSDAIKVNPYINSSPWYGSDNALYCETCFDREFIMCTKDHSGYKNFSSEKGKIQ